MNEHTDRVAPKEPTENTSTHPATNVTSKWRSKWRSKWQSKWQSMRIRERLRRVGVAWWPRIGVLVIIFLAFLVGRSFGSPSGTNDSHTGNGNHEEESSKDTIWTCSMHPQFKLPEPGSCPICGMDLIPIGDEDDDPEASDFSVSLSERARKLAEVRTTPVRRAEMGVDMRLLGRLEYDETGERTVAPWTAGRIERLFVNSIGARVGRGQVIAHLFSPEIYSAHQDLIQARRQLVSLDKGLPIAQSAGQTVMEATRNRLLLLGVSSEDIDQMERADKPWHYVRIHSNFGGTVLDLHVAQGSYVSAGTPMFRLADLSRLWVQLDAYEGDLAHIAPKQEVTLRVDSFPGEVFKGKVSFIDPVVDPRLRTTRVRVEVSNKSGQLRPGMFAQAVLESTETKSDQLPLVIPASAPLFTGTRSVVYVKVPGKDRPTYEAREVGLGPRAADLYPVVSGLEENDLVVVQGAFRLDSDLQIRGGRSMMTMNDDLHRSALAPVDVPEAFLQGLAPLVDAYISLQLGLSQDNLEASRKSFGTMAEQASSFQPRGPEEGRKIWKELGSELVQESLRGGKAEDLEAARKLFESVSAQVIQIVQRFGNPLSEALRLAYCPMAAGSKGAFWLQKTIEVENPYFGASMFACGEVRESVDHGKRLPPDAIRDKKATPPPPEAHNH